MKKIVLVFAFLIAFSLNAQPTSKQVEISKKFKVMITKIKMNSFFSFITDPEKMTEIYDCKNSLDFYKISGENYFIKIDLNDNITIFYDNGEYHFNFIDNDFVGHGYALNTRENELSIYYFQNNKTIKKTSIAKR